MNSDKEFTIVSKNPNGFINMVKLSSIDSIGVREINGCTYVVVYDYPNDTTPADTIDTVNSFIKVHNLLFAGSTKLYKISKNLIDS